MSKSYCQNLPMWAFRKKYSWEPDTIWLDEFGNEYVGMYAPLDRNAVDIKIVKVIPNPNYVAPPPKPKRKR